MSAEKSPVHTWKKEGDYILVTRLKDPTFSALYDLKTGTFKDIHMKDTTTDALLANLLSKAKAYILSQRRLNLL